MVGVRAAVFKKKHLAPNYANCDTVGDIPQFKGAWAMRLGILRTSEDEVEQLEKILQRSLTPKERKWLGLAERFLTTIHKTRPLAPPIKLKKAA